MPKSFTRGRRRLRPYHVYNQGAKLDGRNPRVVFLDDDDRRFFLSLLSRHLGVRPVADARGRVFQHLRKMVVLLAYCVMGTHYHLILWQRDANGICELMNRVIGAYSRYFNRKYGEAETLFDGRYRAKPITTRSYFKWLVGYVHDNHRDGLEYEFSSHRAWVDPDQRPGWIDPKPALDVFGGIRAYARYLKLRDRKQEVDREIGFGDR